MSLRRSEMNELEEKWKIEDYLNLLRESGVTNMFGAVPYIMDEFPYLSRNESKDYLINWMRSFNG